MELYHIHINGIHDRLYKEKSEFTIDKNRFNNRLYNRIYNENNTIDVDKYPKLIEQINNTLMLSGYFPFDDKINLGTLFSLALELGVNNITLKKLLEDAKKMAVTYDLNLRERAMEEYRINNCPNIPSRLHSLYACSEEGIEFWKKTLSCNNVSVFRIETYDEPFVSNNDLLPDEPLCYGDKVKAAYQYFHPKEKELNSSTNEYLVQGKIKLLEKIM